MPQYECKICKPARSFKTERDMKTHAKTHGKTVKCKHCDARFNTNDQRVIHTSQERLKGNGHQGRPRPK